MHRCYLPTADWSQSTYWVEGEEAHHAIKVMRMREGDQCELFDGKGVSALVKLIATDGTKAMQLELIERQERSLWDSLPQITLALAIPKGANMELIMQKAVELGATRIIPLMTQRTIVRLKAKEAQNKQEKWQRIVLEACKQSGVSKLPEVETPQALESFLLRQDLPIQRICCAIVPHARPMRELLEGLRTCGEKQLILLVGPEGDFTPEEYEAIESAAYLPASLGPIILRVETAVFMALSHARYAL